MNEKIKAAILTSFAADSLALGVHWIYNTHVIDKKLGRVETLLKPEIASFHRGKERGAFTHYGDQTMVLMESVAARDGFDLSDFAGRWQALFADYAGYVDQATKGTLARFAEGAAPERSGSSSSDLGGAARIAPLLLAGGNDTDRLVSAARLQTAMTHNHPAVVASAEFFARAAAAVLAGNPPLAAVRKAAETCPTEMALPRWVEAGLDSRDMDTRKAIADFGQMCEAEAAFPATLHLIAKYPEDPGAALVENVMAGGDSAARGLLAGMILGAHKGLGAIPDHWVTGMVRYDRLKELLKA